MNNLKIRTLRRNVFTKRSKASAHSFQYTPLSPNTNEIRLLRLATAHNQSSHGHEIQCNMIHTSLNSAPPYQALSYTWGDEASHSPTILLESCKFHVRPNLHSALAQFQSSHFPPEYLWIDAICINQDDTEEKNSQVWKMKSIFQSASRVIVWLGPSNFMSSDAFALLHSLETYQSSHHMVHKIIQDPKREKEWRALINLFQRPYWRRVWVIQEVQVAKSIALLCGEDSIEWSSLLKIQGMLWDEHAAALLALAQSTRWLRNLQYWIRGRGARGLDKVPLSPQGDLFRTLLFHRLKQSTDPRDKIYGLLGLSSASDEIEVDYRQDVRQVYIDTATYVIRSTGKLDVLWAVPPNRDGFNLPSWVPDWSVDEKMQAELAWGLQESKLEYIYHASGDTRAEATVEPGKGTLVARGIVVTSIEYLGGATHMTHSRDIPRAVFAVHEWRRLMNEHVGDDADLAETFVMALRCGRIKLDEGDPYGSLRRKILAILQNIEELKTEAQIKALKDSMDNYKIRVNAEIEKLAQLIFKRRFILSSGGIMGLATEEAQVGDLVCVLLGCSIPVVLRAVGKRFTYIGDVYLHGYMFGRAVAEGNEGQLDIKDFEIQ